MAEPRSDGSFVRYYCTAGNGMETFLMDDVKRKLAAEDVCQMPGKVLFSSSAGINRVSELKAAERLFLLLKQDSPVRLSAHISPAKAASVLQSRLLGDSNQWTSAVMTWSRLQGELAARRTTAKPQSTTLGMTRKREGDRGSEEPQSETVRRGGTSSGETCGGEAQTLEKKRKRDDEDKNAKKEGTSGRERKRRDDEEGRRMVMEFSSCGQNGKDGITSETGFCDRGSVCAQATPGPDHSVDRSCRRMDGTAEDSTVERDNNIFSFSASIQHVLITLTFKAFHCCLLILFSCCFPFTLLCLPPCNKDETTEGGDNTLLQPRRINPEPLSPVLVSFRISCKCTGSLSRFFSTQEVSRVIGVGLSRLLGWRVDLKNPQLEVHVYLSDDHCLLGIPLTRLPLANRSYIKTTGLRSTVAWAMTSLAQIQPGFCVVDPMCGVGTILIEAAQEHKAACFLGTDIDDGQLQKANENVAFAELGNRIHLLKASSMMLPLPSASVDAVVCDLPFGKKFGTKTNMAANLPLILTEMERVLCIGGCLVLLLSPQLSCLLKKLLAQRDTGPVSHQETKPQTGIQGCPSPSPTKQPTSQIHREVKSPPTQETDPQSGLQHNLPPSLSSLKHQATFRVSLGVIDGLIHKYVKMDS